MGKQNITMSSPTLKYSIGAFYSQTFKLPSPKPMLFQKIEDAPLAQGRLYGEAVGSYQFIHYLLCCSIWYYTFFSLRFMRIQ